MASQSKDRRGLMRLPSARRSSGCYRPTPESDAAAGDRFAMSAPGWLVPDYRKISRHDASPKAERSFGPSNLSDAATEEAHMPAIIIPVLWVGGAAILLGGGWYVIGHMVH